MYIRIFTVLIIVSGSTSWRAIPANQASFSQRRQIALVKDEGIEGDLTLPRTSLHSVFKFGFCRPDSTAKVYLRKRTTVRFTTIEDMTATYVYLLEMKNSQRFRLQCVVLKIMVPRKYLFRRSRLPLYYCQGLLYYVMFNFIQRIEMHELYIHERLAMPADFVFEFYHPPSYDMRAKELYFDTISQKVLENITFRTFFLKQHPLSMLLFTNYDTRVEKSISLRVMCKMNVLYIVITIEMLTLNKCLCVLRDFSICQDNFNLKPADGILKEHTFSWLGFVQYIHVTTGLPHHSKAPRIILVQKQFALGTATDMLHLPKNYKLGNIIFGDYERDEEDCGLTRQQAKLGVKCPRAYIEMPIVDITPHPEYSRFGVGNSLTLVKFLRPMKSHYMVPVCLPTLGERMRQRKTKVVFMVDYISTVPRDFDTEKMGKKTLKLYTHKDCRRHRMKSRLGSEGVTHVLCSSGCGVRPGAPIISHSSEGTFEVIGLAAGGAACSRRSMRQRLNTEPPLYIDVYPYITWIINVITAHILPKPYSHNFKLVDGGSTMAVNRGTYLRTRKLQKSGWKSRTYVSGNNCFKSLKRQKLASFFYAEKFEVNADPAAKLYVNMKISAGIECTIVCARLLLPNRFTVPKIAGVGGYNISIEFSTEWFPYTFYFSLGLSGKNTTDRDFQTWIGERKEGFWKK